MPVGSLESIGSRIGAQASRTYLTKSFLLLFSSEKRKFYLKSGALASSASIATAASNASTC